MEKIKEPRAKKIPVKLEKHGDVRIDNYYWMRLTDEQKKAAEPDSQTQDVLDYLNAENEYFSAQMKDTGALQEELFADMKGRIKEDDTTVPYLKNGYYYQVRYDKGLEYPVYVRMKSPDGGDAEVLLDVNKLAEGHSYYHVNAISVSPDNNLLAFGEDTLSRRIYTIRFKDLKTGDYLDDRLEGTTGVAVWANDNKTVFYVVRDKALRSYKIFRHILGTARDEDVEVFHEKDETFSTYVYKTKDDKYIVIGSKSTVSDEYRVLDAANPYGEFAVFQERIRDLEYDIYHYEDKWFIRTNKDNAFNFKVMQTDENATSLEHWKEFIKHDEAVLINGLDVFKRHIVVSERRGGNTVLRVLNKEGGEHIISFPEEAYYVYTTANYQFDTAVLRFKYTSLTTPNSVYDYNMDTGERTLLKQTEVLGGFDSGDYVSKRIYVTARDGVKVPVSMVYHKDTVLGKDTPLLLYGYGAYGISVEPYFSSVRLSLLNRGFVFAIAHVRGGQEMGRRWYLDGKLLKKKNTFYDFIDVAKFLIKEKYTSPSHLYAMGGSAGGLLMGAVLNMAPDLWHGVIAAVPFVDVLTTMLDESIPLTTGEYDEWGNPNDPKYYFYIKSYSPYDNVDEVAYPNILVTTGFWDSQVQYWEPAKWVAKLRELRKDDNLLIMHCDMDTGHGGASGRFKRLREVARDYAFLLKLER